MRAVIQRVKNSWVLIDNREVARIGYGLTILLGVLKGDSAEDVERLAKKIVHLRIFPNEMGKFGRSLLDVKGEALVVSQFTLAAETRRGHRPDFTAAMQPPQARTLYNSFVERLAQFVPVQTGHFGALMEVGIINDGPVTIILDSRE